MKKLLSNLLLNVVILVSILSCSSNIQIEGLTAEEINKIAVISIPDTSSSVSSDCAKEVALRYLQKTGKCTRSEFDIKNV